MSQRLQSVRLQSVKGMNDILPEDVAQWQWVETALAKIATAYDYHEIRTPILEKSALFVHSIGEQTDIVEKEMYAFTDTGGEDLCMRPENTAAVVRAGVQHGLFHNTQARLWYCGPMFRRERPQKGRYRQFHQFGMEAFGWAGPDIDVEVLLVGARMWKELGVTDVSLHINSLGTDACRSTYRDALVSYLQGHLESLDADSKRRLDRNPLRILDSKNEATQQILSNAPRINDYLDDASKQHFETICSALDTAGIDYIVDSSLVRGLDYYSSTVFEWKTSLLGAQNTICAGGRYDGLVESRGGKAMPAIGFAMGLERLIELRALQNDKLAVKAPLVFLLGLGEEPAKETLKIAEQLRDSGLNVSLSCGGGKLKSQLKRADRSGAVISLILGEDELASKSIQVKYMQDSRDSELVKLDNLANYLNENVN